jgi:effector-binding domain-containing protein
MIKIGDFSRLSRIAVKTLRYYADLGLLRPAAVDRFTGYRYYSASQLADLHRILALKDLGLSLDEIGQLLAQGVPADQLRGMLRLRQAEAAGQAREAQARLARIEARLRAIEQEHTMPNYEVALKHVEPLTLAGLRATLPAYSAIQPLYDELFSHLTAQGAPMLGVLALYHDTEFRERDVDAEAAIATVPGTPGSERIRVYTLPAAEVASAVHTGPYDGVHQAYTAILHWVAANGYQITGPNRELYLTGPGMPGVEPEQYVTEVQFPVAKAA